MTRSSTLWKVSAAAVPVLLLGSMSLATLSANATLASTFGADGKFAITVDGSDAASSQFDLATLKPGETANKTVVVKNVGDITAYTWLDTTSVTGDPAFGAVLTGTVVGNALTTSGPLSTLTSLSATSEAWALAPGAEIPVTLTVSSPVGSTAVIEGSAGVSYAFKASSVPPTVNLTVTYSKSKLALADMGADWVARYSFAGINNTSTMRIVNLLDVAGPGMGVSGNNSFNGTLAYSTTLTSSLSAVPMLTLYNGSAYQFTPSNAGVPIGDYTMAFSLNKLTGIGGSVVTSTPFVLTIHITA